MITQRQVEFQRATQALATDAKTQIALFPPFVCYGDELVLDWHYALEAFRAERASSLSEAETVAVAGLDQLIDRFASAGDTRMFSEAAALMDDPRWAEIRKAAAGVCIAFGWALEPPRKPDAVFIPGRPRI